MSAFSDGEPEILWNGDVVTHRFFEAAGLSWHALTTGADDNPDVVLFLHGFPETAFAWHHQLAALADRFRCIALDLKGHGLSDTRLDTDYDYAAQAGELPAVCAALGIDRFFLVSHDRGAVIADHLCAVPGMADRIRRYVRMQQSGNRPHSEPVPPHDLFHSEIGVQLILEGAIPDMAYGRATMADRPPLVSIPIADDDIERIKAEVMVEPVARAMSASFVSAGFARELDDRLDGLFDAMTMPVLFLQGAHDPGQQPHEYETVTAEVADGHLEFVEAGHFLHLEAPAVTSAAIRAFLTRTDLRS